MSPGHAAEPATLSISLEQALALARSQNAEFAVLDAQRADAEGARRRSLQALLPSLTADAAYLRADTSLLQDVPVPEAGFPPRIVIRDLGPRDAYVSGVQFLQPLVNVDGWWARDQATQQLDSRRRAVQRGRRELSTAVFAGYFGVKAVASRQAAVAAALEASGRALLVAEASYDEGLVASLDVYRARAEVASRRAQRARVEGERVEAEARLGQILGLIEPRRLVLTDAMPEPEAVPVPADSVDLALHRRFDVAALQHALRAAESGVRRARASYLPRLNLLGRYQWIDGDQPLGGDLDGWLLAVNLRWTPFAGMAQAGALDQAEAARSEAQARLDGLMHEVNQQVYGTHAQWRAAFTAWRESAAAVSAAALALERAEERYRQGVGSMTDLLAAQAAHLRARVERSDQQYLALLAAWQYRLAVGVDPAGRS